VIRSAQGNMTSGSCREGDAPTDERDSSGHVGRELRWLKGRAGDCAGARQLLLVYV
jgi:hypothetical protein